MYVLWEVVYLFDELLVELDRAVSDAYQMGASWHQACLALECSLPLLPLLHSLPLPSIPPPTPISVRGEIRTADVQTAQHAYSDVAYVRLSWILPLLSAFMLVDKRVEISVAELVSYSGGTGEKSERVCLNSIMEQQKHIISKHIKSKVYNLSTQDELTFLQASKKVSNVSSRFACKQQAGVCTVEQLSTRLP